MGFFSFLTRKSHDKKKINASISTSTFFKSQSYNSTPAGVQPVQGPYPVPGNGPHILETLTRPRPEFSQTQVSLDADHVAPSPAIPRFRDESVERPSTAPNGSNSTPIAWPSASIRSRKTTSRGPPPVSFRMFSKGRSVVQEGRPVSQGTERTTAGLSQASFGHSRTSSIRSDTERAYKDILDAQSEIRPADFRTRVKAAGARDYGEDVADRNLGENGFNLEAPEVQAFYAQNPSHPRPATEAGDALSQPGKKTSFYASGARTNSLNSAIQFPLLNKPSSHPALSQAPDGAPYFAPSSPPLIGKNANRRQSINTYMSPAISANGGRTYSMDRHITFPSSEKRNSEIRHHILPPEPRETLRRPLSPRPSTAAPVLPSPPLVTKHAPIRLPKFPRDSLLLAKEKAADANASDHVIDEAKSTSPTRKERSFSLRSSVYSPRSLVTSVTLGFPRKRHSLHTLQTSSVSSSVASREAPVDFTPLASSAHGGQSSHPSEKRDDQDEVAECAPIKPAAILIERAASPTTIENLIPSLSSTAPFISREKHDPPIHPAAPSCETGGPDELSSSSPPKTRSVRAWSASSATATISDASSNPFQRPQSRHTVNTSLDLSNASASLKASSRTSLNSPHLIAPVPPASPQTPKSPTGTFNIDDYLSSDDDDYSLTGGSRRRAPLGEGEESLLFNDSGYGLGGSQLPGLTDSLTSASRPSSQQRLQRHRSTPSFSPNGRPMVYTGDSFGRAAGRRFVLNTAADDESDLDSDTGGGVGAGIDDDNCDADSLFSGGGGSTRGGIRSPPLSQPSRVVNRLSAIHTGGLYQQQQHGSGMMRPRSTNFYHHHPRYVDTDVIEEEREGKVDVAAAVKLRKEVKARKRAAEGAGKKGGNGGNRVRNRSVSSVGSAGRMGHPGGARGKNLKGPVVRVGVHEVGLGLGVRMDGVEDEEEGNTADVE